MKILFLTNIPSPYRVDFFNEWGKKCDLTVLYERKRSKEREEKWVKKDGLNYKSIYFSGGIKVGNDQAFQYMVLRYINNDYDQIIVHNYSTPTGMLAIEYMTLLKIKFTIEVDGGLIKKDTKIKFAIKKHFISAADMWLSSGEKTTEYLIHYGANKDKIYFYPFTSLEEKEILKKPISVDEKAKIRRELDIKEEKIAISVGRFSYKKGYGKGYDVICQVARQLKSNIAIYIIGDEPTDEFKKYKKNHNIENLYFVGFKNKEEIRKYYLAADLFILQTREDIWGLVINEAMANALPVITTNKCVAGTQLVKINSNGYIIDPDDKIQLKKYIEKIVYDKNIEKMKKKSLEIIKDYSIENMVAIHQKIFEDQIKRNG